MKKQLITLIAMLLPMLASADAVEIDGIYYNLITKAKQAEVTSNPDKYSGEIVIPESVRYNDADYSVTSIGYQAFSRCSGLTSVIIPNSVTSIGSSAFAGCSSLTSVTIPNSVTSIGSQTFSGCSGLTSITIPNSVTSIGWSAFQNCGSLKSIIIPNSVTAINTGTFSGCIGLTSITIPNSVISIDNYAFDGCSGLTSVHISDLEAWCKIYFNNNSSNPLFYAHYLFLNGEEIKDLVIPGSVTSIGERAFSGCSGLTSVIIPNSVTSIGSYAFINCSGLTSVTIGSGIKTIVSQTFASCPELTDVYCYAENVPRTDSNAFEGSYIGYATLHVPAASVNDYKATEPWSGFKSIVDLDGNMPETQKCATPVIIYENGKLMFACATEGVEYVTDITCADIKKHYSSAIDLTGTYTVSVYATKAGYDNSDVATKEIQISSGSGSGKLGDLNNDGKTDAADVVKLVNIISGQ